MSKTRELSTRETEILQRISALLDSKRLSWAELARRVGKSAASGSQWSGYRVFPTEATLHKIAGALGVGFGWLLTGVESSQTVAEVEALLLIRSMSAEEQRAALAALRGIKEFMTPN
jgi:transcriptional regulator with XRE-family HTH domain